VKKTTAKAPAVAERMAVGWISIDSTSLDGNRSQDQY
jgi:hypothetical protein